MKLTDLSTDSRIASLLNLVRDISTAQRPNDALSSVVHHYWPIRPVDYMISVSTRDLKPGEYRVTRQINIADVLAGKTVLVPAEPWRYRDLIPVHTGGFVGAAIAGRGPALTTDLNLPQDPALGSELREMRSALVVPLYHEGEPIYWTIQLSRNPNHFTTEIIEHALLFGNLLAGTNTRLLLVEEVRALNRELNRQFEEVARVQRALLPATLPEIPGLTMAASYLTADEAGGDYYDFFKFSDGRWGILIADVAGHGPGAATVMAMLHAILHCYSDPHPSPDSVLRFANERLLGASLGGSFVTAFFAVYDPRTGELEYARSGHNPPRLKIGDTGRVHELLGDASPPLGLLDRLELGCEKVTLAPGDTVILYTDGVTEAFNTSREMFGTHRLDAALEHCTGAPDCVVDSVHGALFEHTRVRTRADDQTLVVFQRTREG